MKERSYPALFLAAGAGGGALGFIRAREEMRGLRARFHIAGAVDIDPNAVANFGMLTGHPCTIGDLSTMTPDDLRRACPEPPRVVFSSSPCTGYSSCLGEARSKEQRYQDLNDLAVRSFWLAMETWPGQVPPLMLLENVPGIQVRGRGRLSQIRGMFQSAGFGCRETVHNCGVLGGLAQNRLRFLMVARHHAQVPNFWMQPPALPMRTVGDVLGGLPVPLPGSTAGGPMHRLPRLSALNWLRLALIRAGGDWRDLPPAVQVGRVTVDPRSECERREGSIGITSWDGVSAPVIANGTLHNGPWQVADPRVQCSPRNTAYGVVGWSGPCGTVLASACHDNGAFSVADPRAARQVCVLDGDIPRVEVHGDSSAFLRDIAERSRRPMRPDETPVIVAADGTWHRPMTTLELAAIQGFPTRVGGDWLVLSGGRDDLHRKAIGDAVPPPTAEAIARTALRTLMAAEHGTWELSSSGVWVEDQRDGMEASA